MEYDASDLLRTIGDPSRYRILRYLTESPRNVSEIVRAVGMQQSLVSHHLRILRERGLLEAVRNGAFVRYSLKNPEVNRIIILAEKFVGKEF